MQEARRRQAGWIGGCTHRRPRNRVRDGDAVTVAPCDPASLEPGAIVLVRVKGRDYLHLVKARRGDRLLIGNSRGGVNGWVGPGAVHGVATEIGR